MSDSLLSHGLQPTRFLCPWDFPSKNTGVGCHFLLQEIFPPQGLNPDLLHCRQTLYHLSHQGSHTVGWRKWVLLEPVAGAPGPGGLAGTPASQFCSLCLISRRCGISPARLPGALGSLLSLTGSPQPPAASSSPLSRCQGHQGLGMWAGGSGSEHGQGPAWCHPSAQPSCSHRTRAVHGC